MIDLTASIVIPTHNRPKLIVEAVESALLECPADGAVIVVDDGSQPPATNALSHVDDPRLHVLRNDVSVGAAGARNIGAAEVSSEIIFFLDDDDLFERGYVDLVRKALREGPHVTYGFAASDVNADSGDAGPKLLPKNTPLRRLICATSLGFWIKRQAFEDSGGFDPKQVIDEDTDFCARLVANGARVMKADQAGTRVRANHTKNDETGAQLTQSTPSGIGVACYRRTHDKSAGNFPVLGGARWFLATRYIRRAVKAGNPDDARMFASQQRPLPMASALLCYLGVKVLGKRREAGQSQ